MKPAGVGRSVARVWALAQQWPMSSIDSVGGELWPQNPGLICFVAAFAGATSAKVVQHTKEGPGPIASAAAAQKENAPPAARPMEANGSPADPDIGLEMLMDLIPDRYALAYSYPRFA